MSRRAALRTKAASPALLPPDIQEERRQLMKALHPLVRMLGTMIGHHIEVVLHDLTRPQSSIVAIAHGHVSDRRVGHSILSGPKDDQGFAAALDALLEHGEPVHSIVDDYPTLTRSGQRLKSSTVIFRDSAGIPFAALCLNADLTIAEAAHAWLGGLLQPNGTQAQPREDEPDMDTLMKEIISDAVRHLGKPVGLMNREEKIQAVRAMMQRGLFIVKGGVERAAAALGVTRFTVYNYLEALRERSEADAPAVRAVAQGRRKRGAPVRKA